MRSLHLLLLTGLCSQVLASAPVAPAASALPQWAIKVDTQPPCVRDRLLVRLRSASLPSRSADRAQLGDVPALDAFARVRGLQSSRPLIQHELDGVARASGLDRDLVIDLMPGTDLLAAQAAWAARPEVEWAEFDWLVQAMLVPNDGYFSGQWALRNTGQYPPGGTVDCDIDAELAWDVTTGSSAVKIAIIDTGVDLNHPDLQAKIIAGYDFVNNDSNPDDDNMHGTACASLAAASTNNGTGMAGVDWNARVMPLKVLDSDGIGNTTDITAAVNWARTNGAHVISMSLGGGGYSSTFNTAINNAYNAGIPVICAAGNDNISTISYPAAYANAFAIGALSPCNQRKSFTSCDGETWWGSNYGTGLDVMSPGVKLRSATINGYISDMNGTSGATPQVAGIAGLMKGLDPGLSAQQIYDILNDTADDLGTAGWDSQTGWGRVNAHQALLAVNPDPCAGETVPPAIVHTPLTDTSNEQQPYLASATVTDNCAMSSVTLRWQVNGGVWSSAAMSAVGNVYSSAIPAQSQGSTVHYQVVAMDAAANIATGDWSFNVVNPCLSDVTGPEINLVLAIPDSYDPIGPYVGLVAISDPCGLLFQAATFTVNGGATLNGTISPVGGNQYSVVIPGQTGPATVAWTVTAGDNSPMHNLSSQSWSFQVLDPCAVETTPPVIVHAPLGDTSNAAAPYPVGATITDNCALASATLRWQVNGGAWSSAAMGGAGSVYSGSIPAQAQGSLIHYQIVALDARANEAVADHSFNVVDPCASDQLAPQTLTVTPFADTQDTVGPYPAIFSASDPCGLSVALGYQVNGGPLQTGTTTPLDAGQFLGGIPGQAAGSVIAWTFTATDNSPAHNQAVVAGEFSIQVIPIEEAPVLAITWSAPGQAQLTWNAVPSATGYKVYGAPTSMGPWSLLQTTAATSASVTILDNQMNILRVTAFN